MNYTVIRPDQADVGMLVMGTILDWVESKNNLR